MVEEDMIEEEEFDLIDRGLKCMMSDFENIDIEARLRENGMWK